MILSKTKGRSGRLGLWLLALAGGTLLAGTAITATADTAAVDFEAYELGTVDGQDGWEANGSAGSGCAVYDHEVVANAGAPASFGGKSLRMSNAVTSGCFGDQTFSKELADEAGETTAQGDATPGTRRSYFEASWDFASTVPGGEQPGLSVVASPDRGDGSRMSWVQMLDGPGGLDVNFFDVQGTTNPANFVSTNVVTGLNRSVPHTIKITIQFLDGPSNDVVRVFVDGTLKHTGTTWENYYEFDSEAQPEGGPRTVDSILFRTGGAPAPATAGDGFLIDNLSLFSGAGAPTSTTVIVTGNTAAGENQPGWLFNRDASTSTPYGFTDEVSSIGNGSLEVLPIGANPADKFIAELFLLAPMGDVEEISYDFQIGPGGEGTDEEQFYMSVYANFEESSDTKFYDCRYAVIPTVGPTAGFTTVTFDPDLSYPVTTRGGADPSPEPCPASPADMGAGATLRVISINVGDTSASDVGLDGYLDNVVVNLAGQTTIYDFEAISPTSKDQCKKGGWMTFNSPVFVDQGSCVSYVNHLP